MRIQEKALDVHLAELPEEDRRAHKEIRQLKKLYNEL